MNRTLARLRARVSRAVGGSALRDFFWPPRFAYLNETLNDRWIIEHLFPGRRGGYFIEAGAAGGIGASCTYLLERELGWTGLLVEPNGDFFAQLVVNRPNSSCENVCLASEPGLVRYVEAAGDTVDAYLGGIAENLQRYKSGGAKVVERGRMVEKQAVPLATLLDRHGAPRVIDYLALDIEGSELDVLRSFPFDRYTIQAISLECDGLIWDGITHLLRQRGYREVRNPFNVDKPWERYFVSRSQAAA